MAVGEVSEFIVEQSLCINYFLVAKAYRQYAGEYISLTPVMCSCTSFRVPTIIRRSRYHGSLRESPLLWNDAQGADWLPEAGLTAGETLQLEIRI